MSGIYLAPLTQDYLFRKTSPFCRIVLIIFLTCAGTQTLPLISLLLRLEQMYRRVEERHEMRVREQRRTQFIYQQYMQQIQAANATNPMNTAELKYVQINTFFAVCFATRFICVSAVCRRH